MSGTRYANALLNPNASWSPMLTPWHRQTYAQQLMGDRGFGGIQPPDDPNRVDVSQALGSYHWPTPEELKQGLSTLPGMILASTTAPESRGFLGETVSTTLPSAAGKPNPHATDANLVGMDAVNSAGDAYKAKLAAMIQKYHPESVPGVDATDTDGVLNGFVNHVRGNLVHLYNQIPPEWRGIAQGWYDGANRLAGNLGDAYGFSKRAAAAALAALSPNRDWYMNVEMAKRIMRMKSTMGDMPLSDDAARWMQNYIDSTRASKTSAAAEKGKTFNAASLDDQQATLDRIRGKTLNEIGADPDAQAVWLRSMDEAHAPDASFYVIHPDGSTMGTVMTKGTKKEPPRPANLQWQSFDNIANAAKALDNDDMENLSLALGEGHKVRSFYNNIIDPMDPRHITIDTHAGAAGLLRPLGAAAPEIQDGLGSVPGNNATGLRSLYPLYHEGYRLAADDLDILPRELQSATWEGIRGLFSDVDRRNANIKANNQAIWNGVTNGTNTPEQARFDIVGPDTASIRSPPWVAPGGAGAENAGP